MNEETTKKKKVGRPSKAELAMRKEEHRDAGWGGPREGAGRKSKRSIDGEKLTDTIAFRVTAADNKKYKELKARGLDPALQMVKALRGLADLMGVVVEED